MDIDEISNSLLSAPDKSGLSDSAVSEQEEEKEKEPPEHSYAGFMKERKMQMSGLSSRSAEGTSEETFLHLLQDLHEGPSTDDKQFRTVFLKSDQKWRCSFQYMLKKLLHSHVVEDYKVDFEFGTAVLSLKRINTRLIDDINHYFLSWRASKSMYIYPLNSGGPKADYWASKDGVLYEEEE